MTDFLLAFIAICVFGIWVGPIRKDDSDFSYDLPKKKRKPFNFSKFMGMR